MCRNESVDTNWFIFRHARRLRIPEWTFANVAQTDADGKQFATVCTLEQPATILRKSYHALNQFCKNDSSGKTWLRCWNCSNWHGCWKWIMLGNVDSRCGTSYHIIAFRSMFCQLRVLGRMPLRLKNGWQSFGKDCQGCADCTTWKTWISRIILCRIEANWRTAPFMFFLFFCFSEYLASCVGCGTLPRHVPRLGNTLHLAQIAPRLINVWHGGAPCANVGHVGYVDFS